MDIAEKLVKIAENVPRVYQSGKDNKSNEFWDAIVDGGNKTYYRQTFQGSRWNDELFTPKSIIQATDVQSMFSGCAIVDGYKISDYVNFSKAKDVSSTFANSTIQRIGVLDFSSSLSLYRAFWGCNHLVSIEKIKVNNGNCNMAETFDGCRALIDIAFEGTLGRTFSLKDSSSLSKESIQNIFEHLSTTESGKALTLSKAAVNKAFGINVDDETTYPEGSEYYILRHSRDNWTVSYG